MALNFNLLNPDLPEQIAGSFQQGYQGAQDRANVLEQREQQKRDRVARIIQDGAKAIVATPGAYKSVFARVNKVTGVPLDDDERRYDEAFTTGGEDAVKKLAMADANFDIQTVLSLRDREAYEAYLKGQQPAAMPSAAPSVAQNVAQNVDLNKYPPVNPLITSIGLSQPKAQRVTNALDPSVIERVGLSPQTTNALAPTPTAQAPVAPVNALVSAPVDKRTAIQNEIAQLLNFNDPRAAVRIRQLEQQLAAMEPRVVGGSVYYPDTDKFKTPTRPSSKLIPVLVNGQPTLVPEEQAVGMTPATAQTMRGLGGGRAAAGGGRAAAPVTETTAPTTKPMTELQQRKAKQEQVQDFQSVRAAETVANELEKLTDELAGSEEKGIPQHPGYSRIVGFGAVTPTLPGGDAARAEQKLESFKGKIATFGRQLATEFGKLGNMAVAEWKIISDSVENINPRAGNLDDQMRNVVRLARDFQARQQEKYNMLHSDETQQPSTPAQPSTKGSRTVTRTGMHNGKRVVQYSDGSLEYAD